MLDRGRGSALHWGRSTVGLVLFHTTSSSLCWWVLWRQLPTKPHWHKGWGKVECHLSPAHTYFFIFIDAGCLWNLSSLLIPLPWRLWWRIAVTLLISQCLVKSQYCLVGQWFSLPLDTSDNTLLREWGHCLLLLEWGGMDDQLPSQSSDTTLVQGLQHICFCLLGFGESTFHSAPLTLPQQRSIATGFHHVGAGILALWADILIPPDRDIRAPSLPSMEQVGGDGRSSPCSAPLKFWGRGCSLPIGVWLE